MNIHSRKVAIAVFLSAAVLILWSLCLPGCSHKPEGEQTDNLAPVVWFVNVPPENNQSSTNPIINWVGQDQDGQVVTFRYIVFREDTITNVFGGTMPLDSSEIQGFLDGYLRALSDTFWTYLDVQPDIGDPKTSNIIPMSAELSDRSIPSCGRFCLFRLSTNRDWLRKSFSGHSCVMTTLRIREHLDSLVGRLLTLRLPTEGLAVSV